MGNYFKKNRFLTVGTKILVVVALVTNLFIGALVYSNIRSSETIEQTSEELFATQRMLSDNLRAGIVALQKEFLALPAFFIIDQRAAVLEDIRRVYTVREEKSYEDRETYKQMFNRTERRDLVKGEFILQAGEGLVNVFYGDLDASRQFSGRVVQLQLVADDTEKMLADLAERVSHSRDISAGALEARVAALNDKVAESGLAAERTRNEILEHVEAISAKEHLLVKRRSEQRRFTMGMAIAVVLANLLVLFFLIRIVVERPLSALAQSINAIQEGDFVEIPGRRRTDQIGVLAGALERFRQMLLALAEDRERKLRERQIIDEVMQTSTTMIHEIEEYGQMLVTTSDDMLEVAGVGGTKSAAVQGLARTTATHTDSVSAAAAELRTVMDALHQQIQQQAHQVQDLLERNSKSHRHMRQLDQAVQEIASIIAMVGEITDQTHLLALNATIEAARAGAAGKGFSVVASEMKALADKTSDAASDVQDKVAAIVRAGEILTNNFKDIEQCVAQLDAATGMIAGGVSSQQKGILAISGLACETGSNTHEVFTAMAEVVQVSERTRVLSQQVHASATTIAQKLSLLLRQTTAKLRLIQNESESVGGAVAGTSFPDQQAA